MTHRQFKLPVTLMQPLPVLIILAVVILVFFAPILPTYFLADDYNYVGHLLFHGQQYVQGEALGKWFIDFSAQGLDNPELSVFFRPVVQWLWLTDYIAYGTDAFGYHLTNIILHILNAFLVYLIAVWVLRHRFGAFAAGLLFALHPIHSDSVAWIPDRTDVLSTFFYLASIMFFVLYRQRSRRLFSGLAIIAFALAIGTKENTVALPVLLLAYDFFFTFRVQRWKILRAQIPYWLTLMAYVGARFLFLGQFGRNTGGGFLSFGITLFLQFYTMALAQPFIADIDNSTLLITLTLVACVIALYRQRQVWFGVFWIIISLLPATSTAYVAPRLAYSPSAGLAIALGAMIAHPIVRRAQLAKLISILLFAGLTIAYGVGLAARVDNWVAAGSLTNAIRTEMLRLHPTLLADAHLYFVGVPDILRNIDLYNDNFDTAIRIIYKNPNLRVWRGENFPIVTENLEQTFFLEHRRRKITERDDLKFALQTRTSCAPKPTANINWEFSHNTANWEMWNELAILPTRDDGLRMQSQGTDPYLGSPTFDVPALALGMIDIEMRVLGDKSTTNGAMYWLVNDQVDFSPAHQKIFPVQADGAFHTYRIDLASTSALMFGDRVTRLRFDPAEMPAVIDLRSIRINIHCAQIEGMICQCP